MKIKKERKTVFWLSVIAIVCFIASKVLEIIKHDFNTMDIIMDTLMIIVVVRCLMIGCIEKK
jgi:uncharacterized membrane protein